MKNIKYLIVYLLLFTGATSGLFAQCDYTFEFYDSFGDGWDGTTLTVSVNGGPSASLTLNTGDFGTSVLSGVNPGDIISVTFGGGAFLTEKEWALVDANGNYLVSEPSPVDGSTIMVTATQCPSACPPGEVLDASEIELSLFDSFGDGWNGATVEVNINGTPTYQYTIFNGSGSVNESSASHTITLPQSNATTNVEVLFTGGTFDSEITGLITDPNGIDYPFGTSPGSVLVPAQVFSQSACIVADPCVIICPGDQVIDLASGECGANISHGVVLTGDCYLGADAMDVMDSNNIDGDMEGFNPDGWTSTSTTFGTVWCSLAACGNGLNSINYGVAPNSGAFLAWFGGSNIPETGTAGFNAVIPAAQSAEMCFAFEASVCGNANDNIILEVDGNTVWSYFVDPNNCDANGVIDEICIDMTAYADGASHNILWTGRQTTGEVTNMTVDNVTFLADIHELVQTTGSPDGELVTADETVTYELLAGGFVIDVCEFDITINPLANPVSSITCNNEVNISLDEDCTAIVGADLILEGDGYSCFHDYVVTIFDLAGNPIGNYLDDTYVGQTLQVQVTGPNSNVCWGIINVEDKIGPPLECEDIYTTCESDNTPGAAIPANVYVDFTNVATISDLGGSTQTITLPVNGLVGSTITDVNIDLDITHSWTADLVINLVSPEGTQVTIVNQTAGAGGACENFDVLLDDEAQDPLNFFTPCGAGAIGLQGEFTLDNTGPNPPLLSAFDGEDPNGDWSLTITDLAFGDGGSLDFFQLQITQSGGHVALPIPPGAVYNGGNGTNSYIVNGLDPCGPAVLSYNDDIQPMPCSSPYKEVIIRNWVATDQDGNTSSCNQTISVYRNNLASLTWPPDYDGVGGNPQPLSCVNYLNNVPGPNVTGMPTGNFCDNIQIFPYEDTRIDVCPGTYKILRKWKVLEWCSGIIVEHDQVIKVEDEELSISCSPLLELTTDDHSCFATYNFPTPDISNVCSNATWYIGYLASDINGDPVAGPPTYDNIIGNEATLPMGTSYIVYFAEDDCGNMDQCTLRVEVLDLVSPTPVCLEQIVVGIDGFGISTVFASSFDNGSNDNCEIDYWEARKTNLGNPTCTPTDYVFGPEVIFCCDEIGLDVVVEFRVWDKAGNSNTCWVEVEVQDKLPPFITYCPADITIDCASDDYLDYTITGYPEYVDNCSATVQDPVDNVNIDNCGEGTVTRIWTVIDGEGLKVSCTQTITLRDNSPFSAGDINWPNDYSSITSANNCLPSLDPDDLPSANGRPILTPGNCSLTGVSYKDQVFTIVEGACEKILRTWTVIDWCTYNENTGAGIFTHIQEVKIGNNTPPTFADCSNRTVCTYEDGCHGLVGVQMSATDDCTPENDLVWHFTIDLFDDGNPEYVNQSGRLWEIDLPNGVHRIYWSVADRCNNVNECDYLLTVEDCKKPTPYCLGTISTVVMETNGEIELWANDFDFGSFDNCTAQDDLIFSFSSNVNNTSATFTCNDIVDGVSQLLNLDIWVTDEDGNQDYCSIGLILQDNLGDACADGGNIRISGDITDNDFEAIENVEVKIFSENPGYPKTIITDDTGKYNFDDLELNENYRVECLKDNDPMNGVSTLDLVLIQKHILGIEVLDSPHKIIAADVDDSQSVSAIDLVWLRKLILGINTSFPNTQKSWRFIEKSFAFADPSFPFPYDEEVNALDLASSLIFQDFVGVKIGDINGNASTSSLMPSATNRTGAALDLVIDNHALVSGEQVSVPVYADNFEDILGYQFTIDFDVSSLQLIDVLSGLPGMTENNFGFVKADEGLISTSWNAERAMNVDAEEALFTLVFEVLEDASIKDVMTITSAVTIAESYNSELEEMDVSLQYRDGKILTENASLVLYQNSPNPFTDHTSISFSLPVDTDATMTVFDVTGRTIYSVTGSYTKGNNTLTISNDQLDGAGLMYYKLETENNHAIRKMISIK